MILPFGKYRGTPLADVPINYLAWLCDLDDLREPLRTAVHAERLRRNGERNHGFSQQNEFHLHGDNRKIARRIIESGRRSLARTEHPDKGGEVATMQRLNVVADTLLEALR